MGKKFDDMTDAEKQEEFLASLEKKETLNTFRARRCKRCKYYDANYILKCKLVDGNCVNGKSNSFIPVEQF